MKKNFFSRPVFLLIIIALTMFNNLEHGAELYYKITQSIYPVAWQPYIHIQAYFVIIVIDLAVIGFIVNGKTNDSKAFAWLLFIINCIFWNVLTEIANVSINDVERISLLLAKIFFSAAFSYLIHKVSTLYFEKINGFSNLEQLKAELEQTQAERKQLEAVIYNYEEVNEQLKADNEQSIIDIKKVDEERENFKEKALSFSADLSKIQAELTCANCKSFKADHSKGIASALKSLNAHKGLCKTTINQN